MFRFWSPSLTSFARYGIAGGILLVMLCVVSETRATVTLTADPVDGYGASPNIFTVNPFDATIPAGERANRGVANTRKLRQTFKNPTTFNVGEINVSFDVGGGASYGSVNDTGLKIAIWKVADVLAGPWAPLDLVKEITIQPGVLIANNQVLRLSLTGGDVFTLPGLTGLTEGYGIELSTPFSDSSDGNPGLLWFANLDTITLPTYPVVPVDFYADGRYYTETNTASNSWRDVGLSLRASAGPVCGPGDVDCDGTVDLEDLTILAAHFRQSTGFENGDLTGNGFVDFDDFQQWKQNYSGAFPGAGAFSFLSANVPEPSSVVLLFCGAMGLLPIASRRRT